MSLAFTLGEVLRDTKNKLKSENISTWRIDSELIVMLAFGCSRVQLITRENMPANQKQLEIVQNLTNRRLKKDPMQYILGKCEFMGLEFQLNSDTLIPRGDTECLVELVLQHIKAFDAQTVLDIGTGSGAIIISLAVLGKINGKAVDISQNALNMAKINAVRNNVSDKIEFIKSNLFENVRERYDIIVSNPPYIESSVIPTLDSQVKDYEPIIALDGGADGLNFYKKIVSDAYKFLNPKGLIAFEIGYNQGNAVKKLLEDNGFTNVKVGKDLAGLDRMVSGQLK